MPDRLTGKKAFITGGDSGVGRAVAIAFAHEGADVAIVYHTDQEGAEDTRREVEAEGRKAVVLQADVGNEEDVRRIFSEYADQMGSLDILVNNAAREKRGSWEEFSLAEWESLFRTNVGGYFLMAREALRGGHLKDGGRIINTGSIEGLDGSPNDPAYSATKGAIHTMTKSLAAYLVDRGILVNCVAPGPVHTPMLEAENPKRAREGGGKKYPLGVSTPDQIAPSFVFFASEDASYITGEVLAPTGGKIISL